MKNILDKEAYSIRSIKDIYKKEFFGKNDILISPYNLKRLGFKISGSIAFSEKYMSFEHYLRILILEKDIFDTSCIDSDIKNISYYHAIQKLRNQLDIIEFSPGKFINIKRLELIGFTKCDLKQFIDEVYNFVGTEVFTIDSIRKKGFQHDLDNLGFENWFYCSLIGSDTRFRYRRVEGNFILQKGEVHVTLNDLLEQIVWEHRSIDVYNFIDILRTDYGVLVDRYKVPHMAKEKGLYYDKVMEKIYIDYNEYFEEV